MYSKDSRNFPSEMGVDASERLYYGGLKNMQMKSSEIEEAKMFMQKYDEKELRFRPEINKISDMIVSSKPRSKSVEQRLMTYGKAKNDRQNMLRECKVQSEETDCTFQPKVDKISCQIVNEKSRLFEDNIPKHEYLHGLAKYNNAKREYYKESEMIQNTFTPNVNQYPPGISPI